MRVALIACTLGAALAAADPDVGGPLTGFVVNDGTIRPVLGIPGSARLGESVLSGPGPVAVSSAAARAIECGEGELRQVDLRDGKRETIASIPACPDAMAFSPAAASAVFVFRAESAVRLLREDEVSEPVRVTGVTACAVSDDASTLVCSTDSGTLAVTPDGRSTQLLPDKAAPAAFLPGSAEAVVAGESQIYVLRSGWELEPVADFAGASAVAILGGGETAVVASRTNRKVAIVGLHTRSLDLLDSPVEPQAVVPLNTPGVAHIATGGPGPAWLLVKTGESAQFVFVPQPEGSQ